MQYSEFANEVQNGKGKVPVADYKVADYVSGQYEDTPLNFGPTNRSCYSFCMCPGGQVSVFFPHTDLENLILYSYLPLFALQHLMFV